LRYHQVLISLLVPNASFVGHLGGIVAGLAYVYGLLPAIRRSECEPM
jgi:membrane associated rhomboid family serine protease